MARHNPDGYRCAACNELLICPATPGLSACQQRQIALLLKCWQHVSPGDLGEFDPMDVIAANRGWRPMSVGALISVTIGCKQYTIRRDR